MLPIVFISEEWSIYLFDDVLQQFVSPPTSVLGHGRPIYSLKERRRPIERQGWANSPWGLNENTWQPPPQSPTVPWIHHPVVGRLMSRYSSNSAMNARRWRKSCPVSRISNKAEYKVRLLVTKFAHQNLDNEQARQYRALSAGYFLRGPDEQSQNRPVLLLSKEIDNLKSNASHWRCSLSHPFVL